MRKILLALIPILLLGIENPYKTLDTNEKLNLMINYFLNKELKSKLPLYPKKEKRKDDGLSLEPVKYEFYFNYIQRIKAIRESRLLEQKKLDEKYRQKVAFYNSKVKILKEYYSKKENIYPLLTIAINNGFTAVYGKPNLDQPYYDKKLKKIVANLNIDDLYGLNPVNPTKIIIQMANNKQKDFLQFTQPTQFISS
jgi:hypothetical protein